MEKLSKKEKVQILNDMFYVLNKWYTKENGEETYCIIQFSGNTNIIGYMKQTIKYSEIQHMNNELEIIDYLKK
jgi:hypothetical protein